MPLEGENPFSNLKFFRWPYKWPHTVEIELNGEVYSIRNKVKGGDIK